jgi:hypothetical protein
MLAYGEGRQQVTSHHIKMAAKDTLATARRSWLSRWSMGFALLLAGASIGWMFFK